MLTHNILSDFLIVQISWILTEKKTSYAYYFSNQTIFQFISSILSLCNVEI